MVPARLSIKQASGPALSRQVRITLLVLAAGLVGLFALAGWLNPYDEEGRPLRLETHLQLGLPPCTFRLLTKVPCPSCGMTTSWAFLVRGELWNSLQANGVGTVTALAGLAFLPWSLACAWFGRSLFIRSFERALLIGSIVFLILLLGRWMIVLSFEKLEGLEKGDGTRFDPSSLRAK